MIRSSSESSYIPRSSCGNSLGYQLADMKTKGHSIDVPITRQAGSLYSSSRTSLEKDSPPPLKEAGHLPPNTRRSTEILVRKPRSSKPKPPPRKYFKQDCTSNEQINTELKERLSLQGDGRPSAPDSQVRHSWLMEPTEITTLMMWWISMCICLELSITK